MELTSEVRLVAVPAKQSYSGDDGKPIGPTPLVKFAEEFGEGERPTLSGPVFVELPIWEEMGNPEVLRVTLAPA